MTYKKYHSENKPFEESDHRLPPPPIKRIRSNEGLLERLEEDEKLRKSVAIERHSPTSVLAETTDVAGPARSLTRRERRRLDAKCVWLAAMVDADNVGSSWKDGMVMKVLEGRL